MVRFGFGCDRFPASSSTSTSITLSMKALPTPRSKSPKLVCASSAISAKGNVSWIGVGLANASFRNFSAARRRLIWYVLFKATLLSRLVKLPRAYQALGESRNFLRTSGHPRLDLQTQRGVMKASAATGRREQERAPRVSLRRGPRGQCLRFASSRALVQRAARSGHRDRHKG